MHIDEANHRIVMFFHGLEATGVQQTRVATSADGLSFTAWPDLLGPSYFRVFSHSAHHYALVMPGEIWRSHELVGAYEKGPTLFDPSMRHSAVRVVGDVLEVYWTRVGDAPERIHLSTINLAGDWMRWRESEAQEVLRPERAWEGADMAIEPSRRSEAAGRVNQLRDPAIHEEDGRVFLLYSVAGEGGIGIAELVK